MTPNNMEEHDMTNGEVTAFTFGYLNANAEIIRQTISEGERNSPSNNGAATATRKLAADYLYEMQDKIGERLCIPDRSFKRFMNQDILKVINIISEEAHNSMSILDREMERLMKDHSGNWREENR